MDSGIHDNGGSRGAVSIAQQPAEQHRCKRRRTDVYNVVADQNGAQQAVIPFSQGQNLGCLLIAILRAAF